jgi:ectoine hydroxylase-related dioxygenase (phytanoyl-CoA dioxygenase family)
MFHGRPVLRAGDLRLRDGDEPLDVTRTFSLADPAPAVRRYLDAAGFVVLRQVFSAGEVAELCDAVDALAAQAAPGDRRSWWARDAAGQQVLCRLTYAGLRAPRIAALDADPRVARLAALAPGPVRSTPDRMDGHAVILKRRQIVDGLADLPWHVDCGLGGHPIMCPVLQLSLYLDPATRETGNLRMLAGSWRYAKRVPLPDEEAALPVASVVAAPGDCTLHYGDTMHAAPPPSGDGPCRRSIVMSFYPERLCDLVGPGQAFNDVLLARDDGHVGSL